MIYPDIKDMSEATEPKFSRNDAWVGEHVQIICADRSPGQSNDPIDLQ